MSPWNDPSLETVQLRKADIDAFPIRGPHPGRVKLVAKGKRGSLSARDLARIKKLVIPPAWRDVRISSDPRSHIQAVGLDQAGRRQYIYHRDWEVVRNNVKARRLRRLIEALPRIRDRIARDLNEDTNDRTLATAARLVDRLCLRAGHEEYAGEESGRGVATLLRKHVAVSNATISLDFRGKSKKHIRADLADVKCARNIKLALKIPGRRLFKLKTDKGYRNMTATDLNRYLARISSCGVSAKDFRTLRASAVALERLAGHRGKTKSERRRRLAAVAKEVSILLANTPAVCRKSYIHPEILTRYGDGSLANGAGTALYRCTKAESQLYRFLCLSQRKRGRTSSR